MGGKYPATKCQSYKVQTAGGACEHLQCTDKNKDQGLDFIPQNMQENMEQDVMGHDAVQEELVEVVFLEDIKAVWVE